MNIKEKLGEIVRPVYSLLISLELVFVYVYPAIWAACREWGYIKSLDFASAACFGLAAFAMLTFHFKLFDGLAENKRFAHFHDFYGPGLLFLLTFTAYFCSSIISYGVRILRLSFSDRIFYLPPAVTVIVFLTAFFLLLPEFAWADDEEIKSASCIAVVLILMMKSAYIPKTPFYVTVLTGFMTYFLVYLSCASIRDVQQWMKSLEKKAAGYAGGQNAQDGNEENAQKEQMRSDYSDTGHWQWYQQADQQYSYDYTEKRSADPELGSNGSDTKKYFSSFTTKKEAKRLYRSYCKELHPDNPKGNEEQFKEMQEEYQKLA